QQRNSAEQLQEESAPPFARLELEAHAQISQGQARQRDRVVAGDRGTRCRLGFPGQIFVLHVVEQIGCEQVERAECSHLLYLRVGPPPPRLGDQVQKRDRVVERILPSIGSVLPHRGCQQLVLLGVEVRHANGAIDAHL